MTKIKIVAFALGLVALVVLSIFFVVGYFKPRKAGLLIDTNPSSIVYINGEQVGRTRYDVTRSPGEIVVKLVPESADKALPPYETKITLVGGVKTIIQRDFGDSDDTSSGAIVSFEKVGGDETAISVVTVPDSAQVSIDGQVRGFAPFKSSTTTEGEHVLTISATDYQEKTINVRTYKGYKLTAIFKLAPLVLGAETDTVASPTPTATPKASQVEILETEVGYLRVRNQPSTLAPEVAQVKPGKLYNLLDTDDQTGWFKIEYEAGKSGWITNQYAKKVNESGEASKTPSPTPTSR